MDDLAAPLVRVDGARVAITVTLGARTRAYVDPGGTPVLIIDTGQCELLFEAGGADAAMVTVLDSLVEAAAHFRTAVAARVETAGAGAGRHG